MNYIQLRDLTAGKEFIRKRDARRLTRTEFFFETDPEERSMAINGYEGRWIIQDKEGWRDGVFVDRKEPVTQNFYNN